MGHLAGFVFQKALSVEQTAGQSCKFRVIWQAFIIIEQILQCQFKFTDQNPRGMDLLYRHSVS